MKTNYLKSLFAATVGLAAAAFLNAGPIVYDAALDAGPITPPAGVTFSATGGSLIKATKDGVTFLGVTGGSGGPEISLGQSVDVAFADPKIFASLTLGLLFNGPEYGDLNEIAASLTNGTDEFSLKITGENTGKWYKNAVYQFDVAGIGTQNGGFGKFTINNPFGSIAVSTLKLYPLSSNPTGNESDFGLIGFSTVPDAASSLALLGVALLGLVGFARRVRN